MIKYRVHTPMNRFYRWKNLCHIIFEAKDFNQLCEQTLCWHQDKDFIKYDLTENGTLTVELSDGRVLPIAHIIDGVEETRVFVKRAHAFERGVFKRVPSSSFFYPKA